MPTVAAELLRPGLLEGTSLLVVGSAEPPGEPPVERLGQAVGKACERLGARVGSYARDAAIEEAAMDGAVASAAADPGGIDMLVVDGGALFASGGLRGCLDSAWNATRAVVNLAFLPAERTPSTRRIVYLAPSPGAGEQAGAACAGLENLARTLSVEWARHEITVVTIALGDSTTPGEAAALTAYLASPAGAYFSGCLLDLRGV
jgi:NAD(P)-dependent dehydrogenase (short-subunit alcohol dehydrogenase family)